jgi:hypothetical protein
MSAPKSTSEQATAKLGPAEIEAWMLSREPFTYGALCERRAAIEQGAIRTQPYDHDRLVDRTIQKLRRKGLIKFERQGRMTVWTLTDEAVELGYGQ